MNKFKNITTSLFLVIGILLITFLGMIAIDIKPTNEKLTLTSTTTLNDGSELELGHIDIEIDWVHENYKYEFTQNYKMYGSSSYWSVQEGDVYSIEKYSNFTTNYSSNGWYHSNGWVDNGTTYEKKSTITLKDGYIDINNNGIYSIRYYNREPSNISNYTISYDDGEKNKYNYSDITIDWTKQTVMYGNRVIN